MADYSKEEIKHIEEKWRKKWEETGVYRTTEDPARPKYYVLDMFPYPSGAGLHVGHPLGYIASDIVARYKRIKGFNVLHPMGFDAFGLPAEQYAIQTGQHPAITTTENIKTYKRQLRQIGFSFDWDREVITSDPRYYKWTQWIFMQLFNAWYNKRSNVQGTMAGKTEPLSTLISEFEKDGNKNVDGACDEETPNFTASEWKSFPEKEREEILQKYRIAYQSEALVNWCAALGTVLSNDEVKDGVSERGGYPVERIKMLQWSMRISAYAERLLNGLDTIDWPEPLKEMQRNWVGKSVGCELEFHLTPTLSGGEGGGTSPLLRRGVRGEVIRVFTTRIDTIYGVTFMVLAPEHELVEKITTAAQRKLVLNYAEMARNRSERERISDVKRISGVFTGAYAINPISQAKVPVWISDYVLAGYGTGAIMAVPCSDIRDYAFAKHFDLPISQILDGPTSDITRDNFDPKSGTMINSDFLNGFPWNEAIEKALQKVEELGIGTRKINYRMRDAIFGRQRYWGEPFPVYYKRGIPKLVNEKDLPITLPEVGEYKPTESGEPPLARAAGWKYSLTPNPSPEERGEIQDPDDRGRVTSEKKYWHLLKQFSKTNRQNPTRAESLLWGELRNNKLGHKIRRQHAIGPFIVDFVCLDKRLVIEVDGDYHLENEQYDLARTEFLKAEGFDVIRFVNDAVNSDLNSVLKEIKSALDKSPSLKPFPLSPGEGRGEAYPFELTTMPGWAGSSWYWYRYMDPHNDEMFCSRKKELYWKDVDLYIGGSEHATGHLMYSRFWNKALKDLGFVEAEEPFKKLINQGHIQGQSKFVYRLIPSSFYLGPKNNEVEMVDTYEFPPVFISRNLKEKFEKGIASEKEASMITQLENELTQEFRSGAEQGRIDYGRTHFQALHVDIKFVEKEILDQDAFRNWRREYNDARFLPEEDGTYICGTEVEKMSKSKFNVVNPDDIIDKYGADTLRMYEMFLGPLEQSKPWNTNGIDGVYKFLRKFWNLFHDSQGNFKISNEEPDREELKVLHKTLKKVEHDIENFSFNTSVSEFMICANELSFLKCNKLAILEPLVIALSPFAPHMTEELWEKLGNHETILKASFPPYDEWYLKEDSFDYPISINGKVRTMMNFALDMPKEDIEKVVMASEIVQKWSDGKPPKKVIIVPGKIVNVVL